MPFLYPKIMNIVVDTKNITNAHLDISKFEAINTPPHTPKIEPITSIFLLNVRFVIFSTSRYTINRV